VSENDMEKHETPDLVGLMGAELGRDGTIAAGRHVKGCPSCTEELIDLVVAHAALTAASGVDRDLAPLADSMVARTSSDRSTAPEPEPEPELDEEPLWPAFPPLVLAPETGAAPHERRKRRRPAIGVAAAVAAAAMALGAFGAAVVTGGHPATQPVVAQGSLRPFDSPRSATGTVTVLAQGATRHMIVRTEDLSSPPSRKFYEVWLLDPITQKMLPVGLLPPSGNGEFQVTAGLMAGYSAVDVSLQSDNGNPAHSQTSVLRASL
jgi:anti-sigma-K factor RskA